MKTLTNKIKVVSLIAMVALAAFAGSAFAAAIDPAYTGIGARPLGMGKAYIGLAENAEAVFTNPAGLATAKTVKFTSMYTNLMGDVNYIVLGGVYPIKNYGAIGAGIINTGVSGIPLTDSNNNSMGSGAWNNSVLLLSYGTDLARLGDAFKDVKVGASAKIYSQTGTGGSTVEAGNGSGTDMDLGILYTPNWISVGLVGSNILPGMKVNQDSLTSTLKLGTRFAVIGSDKDKALLISQQKEKLNLLFDVETKPTQTGAPTVYHLGGEYWTGENLALRLGLNQDASKNETVTNITAGIGYVKDGYAFDYAFQPVGGVADGATHYFSISYIGQDKAPVAKKLPESNALEVVLSRPTDKDIVYADRVLVDGVVNGPQGTTVKAVKVNGNEIAAFDNQFQTSIILAKYGVQDINIEGTDQAGNQFKRTIEVMRLTSFDDLGADFWAKAQVEKAASAGLLNGYPDGSFKPEKVLTRAEMATILARMKNLPLDTVGISTFKDVKGKYWAASAIEAVKEEGLMQGSMANVKINGKKTTQLVFNPEKPLTRAEGIAVLARMDGLNVTAGKGKDWSTPYIAAATEAGILSAFTQHAELVPDQGLTRAEFCAMLVNTKTASNVLEQKLGMK